jgi:GTPase
MSAEEISADNQAPTISGVALVGCRTGSETREQAEESLDELALLVGTAGGECRSRHLFDLAKIKADVYLGKGQLMRLGEACRDQQIDIVVFDNDLSPSQQRNIEKATEVMTMDRTGIILDIFAKRARTKEGKLQVELAQLQYLLPRLRGMWTHLSRQGAGIGTRGPGETDLEIDRRRIQEKIGRLKREIKKVKKTRALHRSARKKVPYPTVALVGYTNAGKSTLLNLLTEAEVLVEDKLFATLDPTVRELRLPDGGAVLLSDTVGFIRKLPHQLVESFSATFEEIGLAEMLVHVVDASNPLAEKHVESVKEVLKQIGVEPDRVLTALNKIDGAADRLLVERMARQIKGAVSISAITGQGVDDLVQAISDKLAQKKVKVSVMVPYTARKTLSIIQKQARVLSSDYRGDGVAMELEVEGDLAGALKEYTV